MKYSLDPIYAEIGFTLCLKLCNRFLWSKDGHIGYYYYYYCCYYYYYYYRYYSCCSSAFDLWLTYLFDSSPSVNKHHIADAEKAKAVTLIEKGHLGGWRPEKDCSCQLKFRQPVQKQSSASSDSLASWKFKNPGERFDWAIDRVAVGI